jgi:spermidine/putrescine transport system substrate-binding protein
MEQYEPDSLSPAQLAAMRRSLRNGRASLTRRSLLRAVPAARSRSAGSGR